jgi:hypothetical protein
LDRAVPFVTHQHIGALGLHRRWRFRWWRRRWLLHGRRIHDGWDRFAADMTQKCHYGMRIGKLSNEALTYCKRVVEKPFKADHAVLEGGHALVFFHRGHNSGRVQPIGLGFIVQVSIRSHLSYSEMCRRRTRRALLTLPRFLAMARWSSATSRKSPAADAASARLRSRSLTPL